MFRHTSLRIRLLDEANVVTLEHDTSESLALLHVLDVVFFGIVENQVHVLVEADNRTFNSEVDVLEDPDTNSRAILEVSEDQIDGLDHH